MTASNTASLRFLSAVLLSMCFGSMGADAKDKPPLTVGVLSDFSGPYASWGAKGSVIAAEMASEDFMKANPDFGYEVKIISADFTLKADVAMSIGRQWIESGVNGILDVPHTGSALAINELLRGTKVAALMNGTASNDLVTKFCSPNTVQWTYDQYSIATPTFVNIAKGGKWFFILQDALTGTAFAEIARQAIEKSGGVILGTVRTPTGTPDFSSALIQAQSAGAEAIVLAEGGTDLINALKQAQEFGFAQQGIKIALPFALLPDIQGVSLAVAQGLQFTEAFYWDQDEASRRFSARFAQRNNGTPPTSVQAGAYSVMMHYLKGVAAAGTTDAPAVIAKMKELPITDDAFGPGTLRADGRMLHDMVLVQVKTPEESKSKWDLYKVVKRIPGPEAFRPISSECALTR